MNNENQCKKELSGIMYAIMAYGTWGLLAIYWKMLQTVPAGQILAHRIIWSFFFVVGLVFVFGRWQELKAIFKNPSKRWGVLIGAIAVSINWFVYIWAVNNNQIVEASLGYYINPLVSVILGVFFLKERLNIWQYGCLALATLGVLIMTANYGRIPWIALALAFSFGFYGLIKKMVNIDSIIGLALETFFITPVALIYLLKTHINGSGYYGTGSWHITLLLTLSGIITALPLLWFAQAARRVPLSTMGFIQYLSPSLSLLIGVIIYHEAFTAVHAISFGFIWLALVIYALSGSSWLLKFNKKELKGADQKI